jgi:hypothetical protein
VPGIDGSAEEFHSVILIAMNLDVIDHRTRSNTLEGDAVQLVIGEISRPANSTLT